jgi:long-chain fatty acid transport protein
VIAIAAAMSLGAAPIAGASPVEVFGLTSRYAAQANAGAATADDPAALYYDPAGLAASPAALELGAIAATSHLAIGDHLASLSDHGGAQLAAAAPLPLGGPLAGRIVVGIALHLLPGNTVRVIAPAPDQAFYPLYGDRLSRIVVLPGVAVRLGGGWSVGAAANTLAGLTGTIAATEGATRAIDARVDERVPTIVRAIAGVQWRASAAWQFGATYRQRFSVPFATAATTTVAGEPIDLNLRANGQFTPDEVVLGAGWRGGPLQAALDLQWSAWSEWGGPYVAVDSALPLVGPVPGQLPAIAYKDTIAVRAGLAATFGHATVRGGYAFETSPIPAQQTASYLLDGPKHTFALGGGYRWRAGGHDVRLDAHVQVQRVDARDTDATRSGGEVMSAGLTLGVGL